MTLLAYGGTVGTALAAAETLAAEGVEAEVVDLVVAGLSNAEVARRLFLSERTVETHLQHVYRRLGVDSRLGLITKLGAASSEGAEGA